MRPPWPSLALAVALTGCGARAVDVPTLVERCGVDCAADALALRLARAPRDRDALVALAALDEARGRPGAALAGLERAEALGRPFRAGLGGAERARLGRLLRARAEARAARGSPGAALDVAHLRRLGVRPPAALDDAAARAAILVELRHTDPRRRARARRRLATLDAPLAAALDGSGDAATTERAATWLASGPARRALHELLDRHEQRVGVAGFAAMTRPAWMLDRWLEGRRWWHGDDGRPDLATLEHARVAGADPCLFAGAEPARRGCDVRLAAATAPGWEASLVAAWLRAGVRAGDADEAAAWTVVARRAADRGQLAWWPRAVAAHGGAPAAPGLAPQAVASAAHVTWEALAVELAAADADPGEREALAAIARGFTDDAALADRATEAYLAGQLDVARAAPRAARLFTLLADPARARALWQRAHDAVPADPALTLGLALACADAGDPDAAWQWTIIAAAASGDAGATLLAAARVTALVGPPEIALSMARAAFGLAPPGEEGPAAALAARLLDQLGRHDDATRLRARAGDPAAWDLSDEEAAIAGWRALATEPDHRDAALAGLRALAADGDPARQRLAGSALRALLR